MVKNIEQITVERKEEDGNNVYIYVKVHAGSSELYDCK
jgi:hypothetical protein